MNVSNHLFEKEVTFECYPGHDITEALLEAFGYAVDHKVNVHLINLNSMDVYITNRRK